MVEKIAHITDLHLDETYPFENLVSARKRFDQVLKDIEEKDIKHIICTGDIGENKGIQYFFERVKNKNLSITLGNHDSFINVIKYYDTGADYNSKKIYKSYYTNYFKFIYLDSSEGIIDKNQLVWLEKELISQKPVIIFMHHPILGLDLKVDDIGKLENRDELVSILIEAHIGVTIFCGHYHMESSLILKNISQNITPAVAFQIKKSTDSMDIDTTVSGYRIIEIENNNISSDVIFLNNAD